MVKSILQSASQFCGAYKHRLTEPRLAVLDILSSSDKPLKAYEILEQLGKVIPNPKPPTVYRAIDFWVKHGFIHRIESLNAYVTCNVGHQHCGSQFMICDDCGTVIETHLHGLSDSLQKTTSQKTFTPLRWNLEIHGTCAKCA